MAPALLPLTTPSPPYPKPPRHRNPGPARPLCRCGASRRDLTIHTTIASAAAALNPAAAEEAPPPRKGAPVLGGIANTRSWSQYYGSGFSIRVPPSFDDILEPEVLVACLVLLISFHSWGFVSHCWVWASLRFGFGLEFFLHFRTTAPGRPTTATRPSPGRTQPASRHQTGRSELVSVVIKPSNQLKITFLEAKDITDLGTLKEASKIFVPGGAKLYSARTIKVKDEEDIRTYYFYEFGVDKEHVALMATVNSGKTYIAGATAPETKWDDDGVKLRSAAVSLSVS